MVRVLDLYCGMGGLSLGFVLGIKGVEVLGLDIDRYAVETYNYNLGRYGCRAVVQDVLKWEPSGEYDLVIGSPPCQPYSIANTKKRGKDHPLYPTLPRFFDVVLELKPRAFLMENVKGLVTRRHRHLLEEQLDRVRGEYRVTWRVLNSAYYGVPQRRERVFVLGIRRDLGIKPSFPSKTHAEKEMNTTSSKIYKWVTVREAIGDLLLVPPANNTVKGTKRETIVLPITEHVMTEKGGWNNLKSDWGSRVVPSDKPSYTITEKHRSGQLVEIPITNKYRRLTVRECLRLQGFPDWWGFPEHISISRKYRLVGEAVPPILAYRLAVHISRLMGWEAREPPRQEDWMLPYFRRAFQDYYI